MAAPDFRQVRSGRSRNASGSDDGETSSLFGSTADLIQYARDQYRGSPQVFCKHSRGCSQNAILGFFKNFGIGAGMKVVVTLLRSLIARRLPDWRWQGLAHFLASDTVRFGLFLGSFSGLYKGINCFLRKILQEENQLNAFVAGALAGVSITFIPVADRATIATYLLVRALRIVWDGASEQDWWPSFLNQIPHGDVGLMCLTACQIIYAYIFLHPALPKAYLKFLMQAGRKDIRVIEALKAVGLRVPINKQEMTDYFLSLGRDPAPLLASIDKDPILAVCDLMHPDMGCLSHWSQFLVDHVVQYSCKFYIPLNLVSGVVFQRKRLLSDPLGVLLRLGQSCALSSLFLSTYCANAWAGQCILRKYSTFNAVTAWAFGGLASGCAIFLEKKSRRMELAMYCATPALQCAYRALLLKGYLARIPNLENMTFAVAMGIIMMGHQHNSKGRLQPTMHTFLQALLGIN